MEFKIESEPESKYQNGIQFFIQETNPLEMSAAAHIHDTVEILFITSGSFTVFSDGEKYEISAGDLVLFRSNVIHHIFAGRENKNSYYVLKIRPATVRGIFDSSPAEVQLLSLIYNRNGLKCVWKREEIEKSEEISCGFSLLKKEYGEDNTYRDIAIKFAVGTILLGILRSAPDEDEKRLFETTNHTADCIYKAMAYVNKKYAEDITEADISSAVGLSYHYFSRSFKLVTGKSFKEYLNITRINRAEKLLMTTDKTVSLICSECGYNNLSYFIKTYKKYKKICPGAVREKNVAMYMS